jgi:hypothetical protein
MLHPSETPLLASPQGGVAASSKKFREATEADAAGVVFLIPVREHLRKMSLSVTIENVSYQFVRGSNAMMRVRRPA